MAFAHDIVVDRTRASVILGCNAGTELIFERSVTVRGPVIYRSLRSSGVAHDAALQMANDIVSAFGPWTKMTFPGFLMNVAPGRIANYLDFHGTSLAVDAACASSLAAVKIAVDLLRGGSEDFVLAGGVDCLADIYTHTSFESVGALSHTSACRPFGRDADGTILGEGVAVFALRRLSDAQAKHERVLAVIRGIGASSDGRGRSMFAPRSAGQAHAYRRAYADAGLQPSSITLLEAHGTATNAGDRSELNSLHDVFNGPDAVNTQIGLGSVKSQLGHAKATAGAAGLAKAVLALQQRVLPRSRGCQPANPRLDCSRGPFYLLSEPRPWLSCTTQQRRAGVSAFGFGGTNFHVVLEESLSWTPFATPPTAVVPVYPNSQTTLCELVEQASQIVSAQQLLSHDHARLLVAAEQIRLANSEACEGGIVITSSSLDALKTTLAHILDGGPDVPGVLKAQAPSREPSVQLHLAQDELASPWLAGQILCRWPTLLQRFRQEDATTLHDIDRLFAPMPSGLQAVQSAITQAMTPPMCRVSCLLFHVVLCEWLRLAGLEPYVSGDDGYSEMVREYVTDACTFRELLHRINDDSVDTYEETHSSDAAATLSIGPDGIMAPHGTIDLAQGSAFAVMDLAAQLLASGFPIDLVGIQSPPPLMYRSNAISSSSTTLEVQGGSFGPATTKVPESRTLAMVPDHHEVDANQKGSDSGETKFAEQTHEEHAMVDSRPNHSDTTQSPTAHVSPSDALEAYRLFQESSLEAFKAFMKTASTPQFLNEENGEATERLSTEGMASAPSDGSADAAGPTVTPFQKSLHEYVGGDQSTDSITDVPRQFADPLDAIEGLFGYSRQLLHSDLDLRHELGFTDTDVSRLLESLGYPSNEEAICNITTISDLNGELLGGAPASRNEQQSPADLTADNVLAILMNAVSDRTGIGLNDIDVHADLEGALGIDSITRGELLVDAQQSLGPVAQKIGLHELFEPSTLHELARRIGDKIAEASIQNSES